MTQHGTIMLVMLLMMKILVKLLMMMLVMLMKHTLAGHTSDPACHYHAGGCGALAFANTAWLKYHRDHYVDDGFHGDGEHERAAIMLSQI